ncbi:class I SAM-dependent methyltransferase [Streptomyces sp. NBC_01190]|uniref:class I SAM-dependent methyltransferase n=1 Tax=Streptomyces sp. NBC_01190 TaxID=2903767 RepID=UPI00386BD067|nr:class I SAM-dependent methyltransferase [Streptomyces sp. NBC_01190]
MPFDHNDHYHRLLSRHVPRGGGSALDVGCGTGRFARRLAAAGLTVDAIDPSQEAITEARARSGPGDGGPRFERADIREVELPTARYDLISCLASIHHLPFGTVTALREALAPGGVLLILGCYPERTRLDWAWSLAAVPVNALARLAVAAVDAGRPRPRDRVRAPVAPPTMSLDEIRAAAAVLLPGARVRRLLFWRYLLVFRAGG